MTLDYFWIMLKWEHEYKIARYDGNVYWLEGLSYTSEDFCVTPKRIANPGS